MKVLVFFGLVALTCAQINPIDIINQLLGGNRDNIHGYRFEIHSNHNLMLVRNTTSCFLVDINTAMATKLKDRDVRESIEDQLYIQIKAGQGEHVATLQDIRTDYHDNSAVRECFHHKVYTLTYMPSGGTSTGH